MNALYYIVLQCLSQKLSMGEKGRRVTGQLAD